MPPIKKVYVIYKNSVYQTYVLGRKDKNLRQLISHKHPLVQDILKGHKLHFDAVKLVLKSLKQRGVKFKATQRTHIQSLSDYDLIITIGGDGTFFRTCHHIQNQKILSINSVPQFSVGALCSLQIKKFSQKIDAILSGDFKIKKLQRISLKINGKKITEEPVNDILFTNISPAATSRYLISLGSIKEEQKSSGLWISTASGSTAAMSAAGGKKDHPQKDTLQYLIREPYQGKNAPYRFTKGFVKKTQTLKITSKMIRSKLFLDGPTKSYALEYGDQISVSLSKNVLNLVVV